VSGQPTPHAGMLLWLADKGGSVRRDVVLAMSVPQRRVLARLIEQGFVVTQRGHAQLTERGRVLAAELKRAGYDTD
jgi:Mn-dependent DtxR family transcriptional regulator